MIKREIAATREIAAIHKGQTQYYSQFGHFAGSLAELGDSRASGKNNGYIFTMSVTNEGYVITVRPEKFGSSGRRSFYSDQTHMIHQSWSAEPATQHSPELDLDPTGQ